MFLNPKVTIIINILKNILSINNFKVVKGINNTNIVKLPIILPKNILLSKVLLFKSTETVNRSIKSNAKFKNSTKSIYIFTLLTYISIKKTTCIFCRFIVFLVLIVFHLLLKRSLLYSFGYLLNLH